MNLQDFIFRSHLIHNHRYDYSKSIYVGCNTKLIIICKKHGEFNQTARDHYRGSGCPICKSEGISVRCRKSLKNFITDANNIHRNRYDYSFVDYKIAHQKVKILCPFHGIFSQKPNAHLNGQGCPKCHNNVSKLEIEFLDYLNIDKKNRNIRLKEWKMKQIDGYNPETNTIYEFLGDFWHGNPEKYDLTKINKKTKEIFGLSYDNTLTMLNKLKILGYNVKYIWENDWNKFKQGMDKTPVIRIF